METDDLLIIGGREVLAALAGQELAIIERVATAYRLHAEGATSLPHSTFLRFPDNPRARIIALPAFLGGDAALAGMKWIASFPSNLGLGLDRASATMVLNSVATGRPHTVLEASIVSAKRTAASAALAARELADGHRPQNPAFVGCGLIAFETCRFLSAVHGRFDRARLFDLDRGRAEQFGAHLRRVFGSEPVLAGSLDEALDGADLVAFATTAGTPYLDDLSRCAPRAVILHVSLRDLGAGVILGNDNLVDDVDHVCRAETSPHLAEQQVGHRGFLRGSLGEVLLGRIPPRVEGDRHVIFSPFGLGVLDLAVAELARERVQAAGRGHLAADFLPPSWTTWDEAG